MAGSRKPAPKADPAERDLLAAMCDALRALPAAPAAALPLQGAAGVRRAAGPAIIALSGGRDSVTLLDLACRLRAERLPALRRLLAVHVNHGLQPAAQDFERHCVALCAARDVALEVRRVTVQGRGRGIEAAARAARYQALAQVARERRSPIVLTAHHLDDRIETFLIQWLRGAGPDGLAAFAPARDFDGGVALVRPLAGVARAQIDAYARLRKLAWIDDPSNADPALLRNALRQRVLPALEAVRPGYARSAARAIDLVAEAAATLADVGAADLAYCTEGAAPGTLRLDRLAQLAPPRQALAVRRWLAGHDLEAPSRARLQQAIGQSLRARSDARLLVRLGGHELRRHRGLLVLRRPDGAAPVDAAVQWHGEPSVHVAAWNGTLHFEVSEGEGFAPEWLAAAPLQLRARRGGERIRPHIARPTRTLKRAFQDAGIPEYERADLPLVWRGDQLLYVAGVGHDVRLTDADGPRVRLRWERDRQLLDD